nr:MAG TPA: hypothetical protein [Caudoviricetes sp.]
MHRYSKSGKHRVRWYTSAKRKFWNMALSRDWLFEYFSDVLDIRLVH